MSYKAVLVHVDKDKSAVERIGIAARIANAEDAHLIGAAVTGISRFMYQPGFAYAGEGMAEQLEQRFKELNMQANANLSLFEGSAKEFKVKSWEARAIEDEAGEGISMQARYCDLVVIGQADPDTPSPTTLPDFPEFVIMHCARPVLIVPHACAVNTCATRVLIAWDAGMHATRAVTGALPLLRRAKSVDIVMFNPAAGAHGEEPGADIALYLSRHGIKVNVIQKKTDSDVGNALLSTAADRGIDLIVMGCYGHSRFREILLGGASRTMLNSMTVPVLMAH